MENQNEPLALKIEIDDIASLLEMAERTPKCTAEMGVVKRARNAMNEFMQAVQQNQQQSMIEAQRVLEAAKNKDQEPTPTPTPIPMPPTPPTPEPEPVPARALPMNGKVKSEV